MTLTIQPLTPERARDYFGFFDGDAFADHTEWSWCYCTFYHMDKNVEAAFEPEMTGSRAKDVLRGYAASLVQQGALNGYLAYDETGRVIGFVNAGGKPGFKRIAADADLWAAGEPDRILSVVCFIVAADMRGKGVASALLDRALADAKANGYEAVEAYPSPCATNCFEEYHGPMALYEKHGFDVIRTLPHCAVVRKAL